MIFYVVAVTFCANSEALGNRIAIDGFYANDIQETVCSCTATSKKDQKFQLQKAQFLIGNENTDCGTEIRVSHKDGGVLLNCKSLFMSTNVELNEEISLHLRKFQQPFDTRYCIILGNIDV